MPVVAVGRARGGAGKVSRRRGRRPGWVPNQHGAWAMLAVPFLAGVVRGGRTGPICCCWSVGWSATSPSSPPASGCDPDGPPGCAPPSWSTDWPRWHSAHPWWRCVPIFWCGGGLPPTGRDQPGVLRPSRRSGVAERRGHNHCSLLDDARRLPVRTRQRALVGFPRLAPCLVGNHSPAVLLLRHKPLRQDGDPGTDQRGLSQSVSGLPRGCCPVLGDRRLVGAPLLAPVWWTMLGFFAMMTIRAAVMAGRRVKPMNVGLGELAASTVLLVVVLAV